MGNRPRPKQPRKSVLIKIGGIPVKEVEVDKDGEIHATLNVHLSKEKVDIMLDAGDDQKNAKPSVVDLHPDTLRIIRPMTAPGLRVTKSELKQAWDDFVKPTQDSGETMSDGMRAIAAALRSVYAGLPDEEEAPSVPDYSQINEVLGFPAQTEETEATATDEEQTDGDS